MTPNPTLADARLLCDAAASLIERALERARTITEAGKRIDDHQVLTERVAYAATAGARGARSCVDAVELRRGRGGIAEVDLRRARSPISRAA